MLLGDSIEFDHTDHYVCSEDIPMISDICLSDIWIPSHLLPNRGKVVEPVLNKSIIFRTLERPVVADCFSVYVDINCQKCEASTPPENDILDKISRSHIEGLTYNKFMNSKTHDTTVISLEGTSVEKCTSTISYEFNKCLISQQSTENTLCDVNNHFISMNDFSDDVEGNYSSNGTNTIDQPNASHIPIEHTLSESLKDSLEEICSDDNIPINLTQVETSMYNLRDPCTISDDSSCEVLKPCSSIKVNGDNFLQARKETEHKVVKSVQYKNQEFVAKISDDAKNSDLGNMPEDNLDFKTEEMDSSNCFHLIDYPVPYQRPPLEDTMSKKRNQKEKKKHKIPKKNVLLETFSQSTSDLNEYEEPKYDAFYESVRSKQQYKSYAAEYPSLNKPPQISYMTNSVIVSEPEEKPEVNFKTATSYLYEQLIPASPDALEIQTDEDKPEKVKQTITIAIENIPKDVTQEDIENLVLGYGELTDLSMEPNGKFLKAYLGMDVNSNVEWIIECLNGTQPFGATGEGSLKCYQL